MNIVPDIFSVLVDHWQLIAGTLLMVLFSQVLVASALKLILRGRLTSEEYLSLAAAGWILPLLLAAGLWLAWGVFQGSELGGLVLLLIITILAIALFLRARKEPAPDSRGTVFILFVLMGAFFFLRLAFVSKAIVPLYFDSAQHYQIIKNIIRNAASGEGISFVWPVKTYYHMGFHLLTAFAASALGANSIDAILILGQIIVAVIPLSMFFLAKQETQSNRGAIFAVLLAAFGWYMPAYAVNWGKYPALTSLPLIMFVTSLAYLSFHYRGHLSKRSRLVSNTILFLGILITGLVHSRSLVVLGMIALAWIMMTGWQKLSYRLRLISFLTVLLGIVVVIFLILSKEVFNLLFDPYWNKGSLITCVVVFLAIFGQWQFPRLTFASILFVFFALWSILIPVRVPGYGLLTLLDRPLAEMILYLPLSFLGGAGLAGLEKSLQQASARLQSPRLAWGRYAGALFIVFLLLYTGLDYNFYPAGCCEIVGRDDLVAIDWMDKNLPAEARILISTTELRVLASDSPQGAAGGDAGVWITPLTGRTTVRLPYQSDFSRPAVFNTLCRRGAGYLYVGETGTNFDNGLIAAFPDRYRILLSMPKVKVYQVGCPPAQ